MYQYFNFNTGSLLALDVNKSADFLLSGVNVDLQWTHDESFASYDVTTVPPTSITVRGTSANFTAAYNTLYVVRVVAQLLCGETITRRVEINYGKHLTQNQAPLILVKTYHSNLIR